MIVSCEDGRHHRHAYGKSRFIRPNSFFKFLCIPVSVLLSTKKHAQPILLEKFDIASRAQIQRRSCHKTLLISGAVHRQAARLSIRADLVCGCEYRASEFYLNKSRRLALLFHRMCNCANFGCKCEVQLAINVNPGDESRQHELWTVMKCDGNLLATTMFHRNLTLSTSELWQSHDPSIVDCVVSVDSPLNCSRCIWKSFSE